MNKRTYNHCEFIKGEKFIDAKGRKFIIDGVWWKQRKPHTVDILEENKKETKNIEYSKLTRLFNNKILIYYPWASTI